MRQGVGQGPQLTYRIRFTEDGEADLVRLYEFVLENAEPDWAFAERAIQSIRNAIRSLELSPFSYRKATSVAPFLRELVIPFGASGYVALFEIDNKTVTILAVRHQREEDYH